MHTQHVAHNFKTDGTNPSGGTSTGLGIEIKWQDGTLVNPNGERIAPNGAFVETVIQVAIDRLEFYNGSKFRCRENSLAITKLEEALHWLHSRTARREKQGIEGTHQEDVTAQ